MRDGVSTGISHAGLLFWLIVKPARVWYGEYEAAVAIDGELLAGSLPRKQLKIVAGWLPYHEEEAYKAWNLAVKGEHFDKIPPMM